jgi:hypothetical protein
MPRVIWVLIERSWTGTLPVLILFTAVWLIGYLAGKGLYNYMPETITLSKDRFRKVLTDFEVLLEDVTELVNHDDLVRQRIADVKTNPSIGKTEEDLDSYLKKRGIKVD